MSSTLILWYAIYAIGHIFNTGEENEDILLFLLLLFCHMKWRRWMQEIQKNLQQVAFSFQLLNIAFHQSTQQ